MTSDEKRSALDATIAPYLRSGYRIESRTDDMAVLIQGKPVNHILHLLLSFFTLGLWLIVWLILVLAGGEKRRVIYAQSSW